MRNPVTATMRKPKYGSDGLTKPNQTPTGENGSATVSAEVPISRPGHEDVLVDVDDGAAALDDALVEHAEILVEQHDLGGGLGDIGPAVDRDARIRRMQGRRIVDPVTEEADGQQDEDQRIAEAPEEPQPDRPSWVLGDGVWTITRESALRLCRGQSPRTRVELSQKLLQGLIPEGPVAQSARPRSIRHTIGLGPDSGM
jgi:hypothetical protein